MTSGLATGWSGGGPALTNRNERKGNHVSNNTENKTSTKGIELNEVQSGLLRAMIKQSTRQVIGEAVHTCAKPILQIAEAVKEVYPDEEKEPIEITSLGEDLCLHLDEIARLRDSLSEYIFRVLENMKFRIQRHHPDITQRLRDSATERGVTDEDVNKVKEALDRTGQAMNDGVGKLLSDLLAATEKRASEKAKQKDN